MKSSKKIVGFLLFFILCNLVSSIYAASLSESKALLESNMNCGAAILMEQSTGKIIYEKNAYERRFPASTTKIMTAILTIENCDLDEKVTASENAIMHIPYNYSTAAIRVGEVLTVRDVLYSLMVTSANEAAIILAEHVGGGSEQVFYDMMNAKAKELGCKDTHFVNANGIHDDNHYSTAYDLAVITRYAMNNATFREVVQTEHFSLPATEAYDKTDREFHNTNSLIRKDNLYYYAYATGVKTGYTQDAGNCLVSAAEKDGISYVAVVLNAPQTYENGQTVSHKFYDSICLFDYAFNNYSFRSYKSKDDVIDTVSIENGKKDNNSLTLKLGSDVDILSNIDNVESDIPYELCLNENLQAPIKKGDIVGTVVYKIDGLKYTADLIAGNDVEQSLVKSKSNSISKNIFSNDKFLIIAGILVGLTLLLFLAKIIIRIKKRRDKGNRFRV